MGGAALVTGGAKRLGRSIALALAREGLDVVVHYGESRDAAALVCDEIESLGARAWNVQADLARRSETEAMFAEAARMSGGVDVLINNASIFPQSHVMDFSEEDLLRNLQINALAPLWLSRAFAAQGRDGSIINLLDSRISGPDDMHAAYHLSKRTLFTLTRMMAREFAPHIRVNGVAPGLVLPPEGKDEAYLSDLSRQIPLQRHGTAEDVAAAVVFLVTSMFITGQVIFVDGGRHLEGNMYV